jgi:hypothetical protein
MHDLETGTATWPSARRTWRLIVWLAGPLTAALILYGGYRVYTQFNPYVTQLRDVKESRVLGDRARAGSLTAAEFDRGVELLESNESVARLSAIAIVQLESERDADRKVRAISALERCLQTADPTVKPAVTAVIARLKSPPPERE